VVDGDDRSRGGGVAARPAAVASCGGGAPAREEGQGQAGELHGAMRKLAQGLIGVGEGRSWGFRGERQPAAALPTTTVPGGDGDGRGLAVELHRGEEVLFWGSIWTEGHRG
jgi:hypothetical protein